MDDELQKIVQRAALVAAVGSLQPIPFVDLAAITPIQIRMIQQIAQRRGYKIKLRDARVLLDSCRPSLQYQVLALAALNLVPYVGDVLAARLAYAMTRAFGDVADRYFRSDERPSTRTLRAVAKSFYRKYRDRPISRAEIKRFKQQARALRALKKRRRREHMSQEVYERELNATFSRIQAAEPT